MMIETEEGTYNVECTLDALKDMELVGLRPIKILSETGEDPMNIRMTDMVAMLNCCSTLDGVKKPISKALETSGYGMFDIMQIFTEVFTTSPFFIQRRLSTSSPSASEPANLTSGDAI